MPRIHILQLRRLCILTAAVIGLRAIADASSTACPPSIPSSVNFSSKGRFQNRGTLAFVNKDLNSLRVRGGSDSDMEYDNEYDDESDEEEVVANPGNSDLVGIAISTSKKTATFVGSIVKKLATQSLNAIRRAINAGLDIDDADESEDQGLVSKILDVALRMVKAALNFDESIDALSEDELDGEADRGSEEENEPVAKEEDDFGSYLSKAYGVDDNRGEDGPITLGGSLASALETARSKARMLVIFIPIRKPSKGKNTKDSIAIESILSAKVAKAANKRASKNGGETGSFLFWAASAGSSESTAAMKRLKGKLTTQKGEKRPLLAVAYPVLSIAGGKAKVAPKIVAQHHCSPPPEESVMASWLDSLRKRHGKMYAKLQKDLKEAEFFKEREEGYSESVKSDIERKKQVKEEEAVRAATEKVEKERQKALEARRVELRESLPEEDTSKDAKKVALRFQDGQSGQRQFPPDSVVSDLFNWVDAIFEMERETVVLTSMNGKITLKWDEEANDRRLEDLGLGRNTGFRVSEAQEETDEEEEEEN